MFANYEMYRFLQVVVWLSDLVLSSARYEPVWSYDSEESWPGTACRDGGSRQSPIDIRTSTAVRDFGKQFIKYGPLQFVGYRQVLVSGINNGHTVQFSCEGDEAIHPTLTGGPLQHFYRLEQLHFHWLSEHAVDGAKYPMEIHFVHVRVDLGPNDALNHRDGLAIVSIFCNVRSELDEAQQRISDEVMQHIPKLTETGSRISGVLLDMTKLLRPHGESYYTYAGSLTSPSCNEAVIWIIYKYPIFISDTQYQVFSRVGMGRPNFRSLQRLHSHAVYEPANPQFHTPKIVEVFGNMYSILIEFFRNVTSFVAKGFKAR